MEVKREEARAGKRAPEYQVVPLEVGIPAFRARKEMAQIKGLEQRHHFARSLVLPRQLSSVGIVAWVGDLALQRAGKHIGALRQIEDASCSDAQVGVDVPHVLL